MAAERYHRQEILAGFGEHAQRLLAGASVLVVGAGGIGCPVLQYLCAAGVGCIGLADDDFVSLSNLHRQVLYTAADLGRLKVEVAKDRLQAMNPEVKIITHATRLQQHNILDILKPYTQIIDGTDHFESRYLINDACALLGKPLIFAAASGYEGQLAVFNTEDHQGIRCNYRDLFPEAPQPGEVKNCAENGVLGVVPGTIGTLAAAEAIKLITGIGQASINTLIHYNLLQATHYSFQIRPRQHVKLPQTEKEFLNMNYHFSPTITPAYTEIDITQLNKLREDGLALIVDVREPHEFPGLDRQVYHNKPMSDFDTFLQSTISEDHIILICQHGIRSAAAAEALHEKYGDSKKLYSLKGGIVKWRNYFMNPKHG